LQRARAIVKKLVEEIHDESNQAANEGRLDKERYVIPPHLHDLHEADLPETQRGLVISEIAQFRERAAKREREKMREAPKISPALLAPPAAPKVREWGKPQGDQRGALGNDAQQGYNKPVGFVKEGGPSGALVPTAPAGRVKSDEEMESERKEVRRRDEENSFRDVSSARFAAPILC
jgi:RNA-binding protein 25